MANYILDEEKYLGYLSQIQLPGTEKPYMIRDIAAREVAEQALQAVDGLFTDTEEEKGAITEIRESISTMETKIEDIEKASGVNFAVNDEILVITTI